MQRYDLSLSEGSIDGGDPVDLSEVIRSAVEIGRRDGFVTFDQLNALIDASKFEPEDIEDLVEALRYEGVDLRDK
jgi:hypothetical protein